VELFFIELVSTAIIVIIIVIIMIIFITIISIIIIILTYYRSFEYPSAVPPFPGGAPSADVHLRAVFYRLGFNNRETVALCGAHTIGR